MPNFLAKMNALASAVARCWVLLAIAAVACVMLLRTGQGIESVVADLELPGPLAGGSLFLGTLILTVLIFLSSSWTLSNWRADSSDPSTTYARYTVPVLISLLCVCALPVLIIGAKGISHEEQIVMGRSLWILVSETIVVAMYVRFGVSGAAAMPPAKELLIRLANLIPQDEPSSRRIQKLVFSMTRLPESRLFQVLPSFFVASINSVFVIYAVLIVVAYRIGLLKGEVTQKLQLTPTAGKADAIWALALEALGALVAASLLGVLWFALARVSIRLFVIGALVIVAVVDWQIVRRVAISLVEPGRRQAMTFRLIYFAIVIVAIGAAAYLVDLPRLSLASHLGTPFVLLSAIAFWVAAWTLISIAWREGGFIRGAAVASGGVATLLFLVGPYSEASVRVLPLPLSKPPQSLDRYIGDWLEARRPEIERGDGSYPVIVVAAEGGGIRAGYWAGTVLAGLHDREPCVSDHMLAISGVSGGSIGAGVYAAVLASGPKQEPCEADSRQLLPTIRAILGADLLSAQLGAALISDGIRSVVQSNLLPSRMRMVTFADRSAVFETSLEIASQQATGNAVMERPWTQPWSGPYERSMPPLVIANMTSVLNGERVVLSPFAEPREWPFALDAARFTDVSRLRFSTAIFLSARFPAISPTARLGDAPEALRVVDGGYGDNSGTATARSIGSLLMRIAREKGLAARIRPVFLILTNGETASGEAATKWAATPLGILFDPASTLVGVGTASSTRYRVELGCAIVPWNGEIIDEFKLDYRHARVPLGWMLGRSTRQLLDARLNELMSEEVRTAHMSMLTNRAPANAMPYPTCPQ